MRGYELWDGANFLAEDANTERLFEVVRVYHERYGRDLVGRWMLVQLASNDDNPDTVIAQGDDLITRAFAREAAAT